MIGKNRETIKITLSQDYEDLYRVMYNRIQIELEKELLKLGTDEETRLPEDWKGIDRTD